MIQRSNCGTLFEVVRKTSRVALPIVIVLAAGMLPCHVQAQEDHGSSSTLTFDRYSPLAESAEIVRRTMSPIADERVAQYLQNQHQRLPQQSIDLSSERFSLYVPKGDMPETGYGLVVFIPPYDEAKIPPDWRRVFDRHHLIYVAAEKSGNDYNMLWRRLPLALHAYENVAARYRLDQGRIIISGFSGGSRTAMRVALSYPDVFRAAILNSGSDPFGSAGIAVPPSELFALFQQRSRVVQVSGTEDVPIRMRDDQMQASADRLCVQGLVSQPMRKTGHALMDARELEQAITAIESPAPAPGDARKPGLDACHAGIQSEIDTGLAHVRALIGQQQKKQAGIELSKIDAHFGGLAAPGSVELARSILAMPVESNGR